MLVEYEKTKIRLYENFIREILNSSIRRMNWEKLEASNKMFVDKIAELFKFQSSKDWSFMTSSLDVLGDSTFAIVSFQNYKINNGGSFNTGEKYLRLYGVLSSIYIHFRAISTIADLVKTKSDKMENEFKSSTISFLRNAISAHPVNYDDNGQKKNYKITRYSLKDSGMLEIVDMQNQFLKYDLFKSIEEYLTFAEKELEKIAQKIVNNRYKTSEIKRNEALEKLKEITQ